MVKISSVGALAIAAMLCGGTARAVLTYDATLVSPSTNPADPGYYAGSGNTSTHFTVDTASGVEIGIKAKYRISGPEVTPVSNNVYQFPTGFYLATTRALWNFDFSVDLSPNGVSSGRTLSQISTTLTIADAVTGNTNTFTGPTDLLLLTDNTGWSGSSSHTVTAGTRPTDTGAQNSENLGFAGFLPGFDANRNDRYTFTYSVFDNSNPNVALASVTMQVDVPEPASLGLMLTGMFGLSLIRRRRAV